MRFFHMVTVHLAAWSAVWSGACGPRPLPVSEQLLRVLERTSEPQIIRVFDGGGDIEFIYVPTIHDNTFVAAEEGSQDAERGARFAAEIVRVGDYILTTVPRGEAVFGFEGFTRGVDIRRDLPASLAIARGEAAKHPETFAAELLVRLVLDESPTDARSPSLREFFSIFVRGRFAVEAGTPSVSSTFPFKDAEYAFIARTSMPAVGVEDASAACRQYVALVARWEQEGHAVERGDGRSTADNRENLREIVAMYDREDAACRGAEGYDPFGCSLLRHPTVVSDIINLRSIIERDRIAYSCEGVERDSSDDVTFERDRVHAAVAAVIAAAEERRMRYAVLLFGINHTPSMFAEAIAHGFSLSIACAQETCTHAAQVLRWSTSVHR